MEEKGKAVGVVRSTGRMSTTQRKPNPNVPRQPRVKSCLNWYGGKYYLAHKIIKHFPPHVHYVEPYFGAGSVLFAKPVCEIDGHSEVVNDRHGELMNFWRVVQSESSCAALQVRLEMTPFAQPIWEAACQFQGRDPIERAYAFFVKYRQCRQGLHGQFGTLEKLRTRRGMNSEVSKWFTAIEGMEACLQRLRRVVIFNEPAIDVIQREDCEQTLFYLDPPYLKETRVRDDVYEHEMTREEHSDLIMTLADLQGKFILSGYASHLYEVARKKCNWRRVDIKVANHASGRKKKQVKTECLWMNFDEDGERI